MSVFGFLIVHFLDEEEGGEEKFFIDHRSFKLALKDFNEGIKNEEKKIIHHRNFAEVVEKDDFSLRQVDELSF